MDSFPPRPTTHLIRALLLLRKPPTCQLQAFWPLGERTASHTVSYCRKPAGLSRLGLSSSTAALLALAGRWESSATASVWSLLGRSQPHGRTAAFRRALFHRAPAQAAADALRPAEPRGDGRPVAPGAVPSSTPPPPRAASRVRGHVPPGDGRGDGGGARRAPAGLRAAGAAGWRRAAMEVYIPSFRYEESELERGYTVSRAASGRARAARAAREGLRPRRLRRPGRRGRASRRGWGGIGGSSGRGGRWGRESGFSVPGRRACCRAESRLKAPTCAVPRERPGPGGFQQRPPLWPPRAPSALGRRAFGALCRRRARSAGFFPHTAFVQRCWAAGRNRVPHSSPRGGGVTAWSASLLCRPNTRTALPRCCVPFCAPQDGQNWAGLRRQLPVCADFCAAAAVVEGCAFLGHAARRLTHQSRCKEGASLLFPSADGWVVFCRRASSRTGELQQRFACVWPTVCECHGWRSSCLGLLRDLRWHRASPVLRAEGCTSTVREGGCAVLGVHEQEVSGPTGQTQPLQMHGDGCLTTTS